MQGSTQNGPDEISEINVIPFIDICLVLPVIVLMTTAASAGLKEMSLPIAASNDYRDMNLAITLSVTRATDNAGKAVLDPNGQRQYRFFFEEDKTPIAPQNLWTHLKTVQQDNTWSML